MSNLAEHYHNTIESLEDENERNDYILRALPFLQRYNAVDASQKADIFFEYLQACRPHENTLSDLLEKNVQRYSTPSNSSCPQCGEQNFRQDVARSEIVCIGCGFTEFHLTQTLGFAEEQELKKPSTYSYKRLNHFNEWLNQFQAREHCNQKAIENVIEEVRLEIRKQRIQLEKITNSKVRDILKKLRHSQYYENVAYITSIVSGKNPPTLSLELETRLRQMFSEVQAPFDRHAPSGRSNFLSYPYVLYKFCELLGEDRYLPFFPLLKSAEKLRSQDAIWKLICEDLNWEFIPTL